MLIRVRGTGVVMEEPDFRNMLLANDGPSYDVFTPEVGELLGADQVYLRPPPHTSYGQVAYLDGYEEIEGLWYQKYSIAGINDPVVADVVSIEWNNLRAERSRRLAACDWTQLTDAPVDATVWAAYRQELRDLPANTTDPFYPPWPKEPE